MERQRRAGVCTVTVTAARHMPFGHQIGCVCKRYWEGAAGDSCPVPSGGSASPGARAACFPHPTQRHAGQLAAAEPAQVGVEERAGDGRAGLQPFDEQAGCLLLTNQVFHGLACALGRTGR